MFNLALSSRKRSRISWNVILWLSLIALVVGGIEAMLNPIVRGDDPEATVTSEEPVAGHDVHADAPAPPGKESETNSGHGDKKGHADGGHDEGAGHTALVAPLLLALTVLLFLAKVGGDVFERVGLPAVLGELVVGVLLGNVVLFAGWTNNEMLIELAQDARVELSPPEEHSIGDVYSTGAALKLLASIGVVILLFEVGLESTVRDMVSVGASSMLVAILGVAVPALLGYGVTSWFYPDEGWQGRAFIAATLCATSVGITARVLKDIGRNQQRESQIILGAAVIDDVLGLVILAVVSGLISQGSDFEISTLFIIIGKSIGFLLVAVLLGTKLLTRPMFKAASYLRGHGLLVATALVICFGFGWAASQIGLDPIVGAFAAGLILERAHYHELGKRESVELEEALAPLTALLVPIFFVEMGLAVDLTQFADKSVWAFAAALTVVAIIGKQVCTFGVLEKGLNKWAVGLGMIPRGEVGLIFAGIGLKLKMPDGSPVISSSVYSAIVVMVMITTMVTPPLLKWSMNRDDKKKAATTEA